MLLTKLSTHKSKTTILKSLFILFSTGFIFVPFISCKSEKKNSKIHQIETSNNHWFKDSLFQNHIFPKIGLKQLININKDDFIDIYRIQIETSSTEPIYRNIFTIYQKSNNFFLEVKSISRPQSEILNFINYGRIDSFNLVTDYKIKVSKQDWHLLKTVLETTEFYNLKTDGDVGFDGRNIIIEALEYVTPSSYDYHKICRNGPKSYEAAYEIEQFFYALQKKYKTI